MDSSLIAIVPIEVCLDKRLTLEQMRVLVALFSFRGKDTNLVWPSRQSIAERTGMHVSNISDATSGLVKLGWVSKEGKGGFSKASRYTLTTPNLEKIAEQTTVAESAREEQPKVAGPTTVAESTTVADKAMSGVADSARGGVADSARGKEHTSEQTSEQTKVAGGDESPPAPRKKKSPLTPEMQEACRKAWDAYCRGYSTRYTVEPVKNAKVAGQIVEFVKRIGMEEAPHIAGWFTAHISAYYVGRGHTVDCLLKDAEKLRTEWATGRAVTQTAARQSDRTQANFAAANEALRIIEERRGATA